MDDDGLARIRATIDAQNKAIKPRAVRRDGARYGDGPACPESEDHGKLYVMQSGNLWCPVSQAIFARPAPGHIEAAGLLTLRKGDK